MSLPHRAQRGTADRISAGVLEPPPSRQTNETTSRFVNRELSWLEFNQRVLDEALDEGTPLLERLKFLAITASNLSEFFRVRVGGLQMLAKQGSRKRDPAGMTPSEQLAAISLRVHQMSADQDTCLSEQLLPGLAEAGISCLKPDELNAGQREAARRYFEEEVLSVFTPMAVCCAEQFPLLSEQTINLGVQLRAPLDWTTSAARMNGIRGVSPACADEVAYREKCSCFAVIPLGRLSPRFVRLPSAGGYEFLLLEDLLAMHVDRFFPGCDVVQCVPFRITRNADLSVREDLAADLLAEMEGLLDARKLSDCVRLEIAESPNQDVRQFLQHALEVSSEDVYPVRGPLDLSAFMSLADRPGFDSLRFETWTPRPADDASNEGSVFDLVRKRDVMLSLPYESFEPVVRLVNEAADDDSVLSIKIILYRTSRNSPIVAALARAAEQGKYVTAVVELKARFDEARNIEWARALEQSGVQVLYGIKGLKTHAKVCIITRREADGIRRYVHFSTGNYNEVTARLYSDISAMTSDAELAGEAASFFNAISGYSQLQPFRHLSMAPISLRERLLELIEDEIRFKRQTGRGQIMAQVNSLADPQMIDALYRASQAGVQVDLNIRGICCLRPGVPGLSENIRAVSIVDRYLEHCRILYFHHGGSEQLFISSADWMPRNLDRRIELLVPVRDAAGRARLMEILRSYQRDNVKGRKLLSSGGYQRPGRPQAAARHRHQEFLYGRAAGARKQDVPARRPARTLPRATRRTPTETAAQQDRAGGGAGAESRGEPALVMRTEIKS